MNENEIEIPERQPMPPMATPPFFIKPQAEGFIPASLTWISNLTETMKMNIKGTIERLE